MNINKSGFRINPVLLKELRIKMRGWRAPILIGIYNLVLTLITILFLKMIMRQGIMNAEQVFMTYAFMAAAQFGLISLIAPALTAGSISGEREKQTLDILLSTTLKHRSIILGKLFASLSHIMLLILSSIPIFSIIFLFGGIGVSELLQTFLFYIVLAITLGSIGLFFSTFIKKSTAANVLSYAVIVFLFLGTLLITIFYIQIVVQPTLINKSYNQTFWLMYLNPAASFITLLINQFGVSGQSIFPGFYISSGTSSMWLINIGIDLALSILMIAACSYKLNPVRKKFSIDKKYDELHKDDIVEDKDK
jgi:ABC-type transport system involved in multi-copper enzyme maturation permease subunit